MADSDTTLREIAERRKNDPLAPATVIVPSHSAGLQLRRRLAEQGAFAAVRFETLPRMAELLGAGHLAAAGRAPLARPIGDYVAQQVALESTGVLNRVAPLPGYARVLRQIFRRLRRGGIRNSAEVKTRAWEGRPAEVLRLYDCFREASAKFYDEEDLFEAAAAAVTDNSSILADLGSIYVARPCDLSSGAGSLLGALEATAPRYQVIDEEQGDAPARLVLAPDPPSEAREVVREVIGALGRGAGLHEVAVFHGADDSYRRLLREAFASATIPTVPLPGVRLSETTAGRGVLLIADLPEKGFPRTQVMDFLSISPLKSWIPSDAGPSRVSSTLWDRLSRDAGITHGAGRWREALRMQQENAAEQAAAFLREGSESRQRHCEFVREASTGLLGVVETLMGYLSPLLPEQPASEFIQRFQAVLEDYFDPADRALGAVRKEIDQLGTVDAVGGRFSLRSFALALRANLDAAYTRENNLGEGVMIGDYRTAAAMRFRQVVLCGAYEGAFPAGPGTDAIIEDAAWGRLREEHPYIEDAQLRMQRAQEAAERAVASASDGLTWCCPLHEPGGTRQYYPSQPMVKAAERCDLTVSTGSSLRRHAAAGGWLAHRRSAATAGDWLEAGRRIVVRTSERTGDQHATGAAQQPLHGMGRQPGDAGGSGVAGSAEPRLTDIS